MVDNSPIHNKRGEDSLNITRMNVGVGGKQALMEDGFFHDANGTKVAVYTGLSPPPQSARPEAQLAKPETQSGLRPSQPGLRPSQPSLKPEAGWLAGWMGLRPR